MVKLEDEINKLNSDWKDILLKINNNNNESSNIDDF